MSQAVLSQLVSAESQLTEQEAVLAAQIAEIQEKRRGIQAVISMFQTSDGEVTFSGASLNGAAPSSTLAAAPAMDEAEDETDETIAETAAAGVDAAEVEAQPKRRGRKPGRKPAAKSAAKPAAQTAAKSAAKPSSATTTKTAKRRGGRTANWQTYVRSQYSDVPLPEVVESVLKSKSQDRFKIAEVMSVIFQEDMPKTQFLKARNRISNILSAGARSGEWYRGRGGTYSVSKKAIK